MSDTERDDVARLEGIKNHLAYDWTFASHQPLCIAEASLKLRAEASTTISVHPMSGNDIQPMFAELQVFPPSKMNFLTVKSKSSREKSGLTGAFLTVIRKLSSHLSFRGHVPSNTMTCLIGSGWATAKVLSSILARRVARHLGTLTDESIRDVDSVKSAFESAFLELDDEIMSHGIHAMHDYVSHAEALCRNAPTSSGFCASLVFLDPVSSMFYAACSGDFRVVMGQNNKPEVGWTTVALSKDQTGSNPDEVARINDEHPGETPIKGGRVLG